MKILRIMKVIRSLIICALSAMHLSLYSCDEYDYYYDCDEQINTLAPLPLSEDEKDVKYLLKLDTTFDQEMDYEVYRQKIKNITDLLVEEDKEARPNSDKLYLSYEKYRKAWNKANPNNQIKIDLPKGIDLNKIRLQQPDVEKSDYKNKRYKKETFNQKPVYYSFLYGQNMLYGLSDDLRSNNDETFLNCLVHHIVNLMLFLPQEEVGMSKNYVLQVGKYDYDGFIAAFNKLKYIIKNSKKSTYRNENDIENLFTTIKKTHNEQDLKKLTGKSFQDLKNDIRSKKIDISLSGEDICILQYNHNYDLKNKIIERMEIFRDEIFKTLNDSGFLGFINTFLFNIIIKNWDQSKYNGTTHYQLITPFIAPLNYEETDADYGCTDYHVQGLTGKQNAIMSFYKHKLSTDDKKEVKCDHKLLIKQINYNKDLKVDELGVIKNVPDNMKILEYLKHLLEDEINMNFFNSFKNCGNNIYVFNDACENGKFSMVLSNLYNEKQNYGSNFWQIVYAPWKDNIYTNYIKENYCKQKDDIDIKFVSKDDFFKSKYIPTIYINKDNILNFLKAINLNDWNEFILKQDQNKSKVTFNLSYEKDYVYARFPGINSQTIQKNNISKFQPC
ncbi:MAG: hypothetical protein IJ481_01130 [Alphaproteobacteria bacterium]|nr:hypothetical protein [Alphaproteobacteria bacterium]